VGDERRRTIRSIRPGRTALGALAAALTVCGCGAAARHPASAPSPTAGYRIQLRAASFPVHQRLAERTRLVLAVRDAGPRALPDVAVTLTNPSYGTAVGSFATYLHMAGVQGHSRAVWVIDKAPGPCGFSCRASGPGAAVTPESHTWALGRLAPGATVRFAWTLTAVMAGRFRVHYAVAADPDAGTHPPTKLATGGAPAGTFAVRVSSAPQPETVSDTGAIVK
jgi:hypothetical protein